MEGQVVCARKGMRKMNIVEALQNPDAPPIRLGGKPAKHRDVLVELRIGKLLRLGITGQPQKRSERMAVPQIERIDPLVGEHIQIPNPLRLVIEEWKGLRR